MARRKISQPAKVYSFPIARHRKIVAYVASEMRKRADADAAEEFLVDHLCLECSRLSDLGMSGEEIDVACRAFARAVWSVFLTRHDAEGAA